MNILLVSPSTPDTFWSFRHALPFVSKRAAFPPLGLLTVAAMLPDDWAARLVDLNVKRLTDTDLRWADYVMLSAMIVHEPSVRQIATRCQELGKPIIGGGPLFTTGHHRFPDIPHFVLGEAENVMATLVADMIANRVQPIYQSPVKPDLSQTPIPRWNLIDHRAYATMPVQFSRGCPFNCEFCDIVAMYGRVPRAKDPAQLIAELDALLATGWQDPIFIVDDNFIGHKPKAKALLRALIEWRTRRKVRMPFTTEVSLNLVDDPELLELLVDAGFKKVFIGIETPSEAGLAECTKVQNTQRDLIAAVAQIQNAGIEVMGGFIVGFDSDEASIFERQRRFIQEAGVVTAMVGLLTALPQTRLFARLKEEGRLLSESTGNNLDGVLNFIPKLDRDTLVDGYRKLLLHLYSPRAYYQRALTFLSRYRMRGPRIQVTLTDLLAFVRSLWVIGIRTPGRREYWKFVARSLLRHPRAFSEAINLAIIGYHFRQVATQV
ncbi:MAG: B12-binding domain-containing radical SAM protein [Phycisphaerae bacterium]|nr:B12-binding domain-containing radical SAM protein [Phycisphaerae bacterium]